MEDVADESMVRDWREKCWGSINKMLKTRFRRLTLID